MVQEDQMKKITLILALLVVSTTLFSWEKIEAGKIDKFEVSTGSNFGFRVVLDAGGYFYLNEGDSNYKAYMAMLIYADSMNYTVTIYSNSVDPPHDLYHIDHLSVKAH